MTFAEAWPVLRTYDDSHLDRVALPLGGIGTGTVSLGGRGDLRDWEIVNRPAKGFVPTVDQRVAPSFVLWTRRGDEPAVCRLLEGPVPIERYEGAIGATAPNHGLPRFRHVRCAMAYPLGQVELHDPDVPLRVRLQAFNPLVPGDADASSLPVAVLRYALTNPTDQLVRASVAGTLPNFIGLDGSQRAGPNPWSKTLGAKANRNTFRRDPLVQGLLMDSAGVDPTAETFGTLALTTTATDNVSHRTAWARLSWGNTLLDFWDDLMADGMLDNREAGDTDTPVASLAVRVDVPPGETREVTFLITWRFPNRMTWTPTPPPPVAPPPGVPAAGAIALPVADANNNCDPATGCCAPQQHPNWVGNHYATGFDDAWAVAGHVAANLPSLEARTVAFVDAFCRSDLPEVVKEAALFNAANLRTQTVFRIASGELFGWEGCHDHAGCCHGSCTHVWNYEHTLSYLFGDLARSMRRVEFQHGVNEQGMMNFRINLPLSRSLEFGKAAADGQMGAIMRLYRDWKLSGDDAFLRSLWPMAKKALAFCWINGGWDADRDGVMEGCQHNTMDVEYFGPNPQMQSWYLGALRACERMAEHLDDADFAGECRRLFTLGRDWTDRHLFNGQYYEQQIRPPGSAHEVAPMLLIGMGSANLTDPDLQLGAGCLIDQLVGQCMAHVCGLGYLLDPDHVRTTAASVMKFNFRPSFQDHFNHLRSYVLADESAIVMCTYPLGRRPARPFPYFNEVMTGFEYTAAVHLIYEGKTDLGLKAIEAIRHRYDGRKRSPFNEAECGHHYARAMAAWGALLAITGFQFDATAATMSFNPSPTPARWFWSNGQAWGELQQQPTAKGIRATLSVREGQLTLRCLRMGEQETQWAEAITLNAGEQNTMTFAH